MFTKYKGISTIDWSCFIKQNQQSEYIILNENFGLLKLFKFNNKVKLPEGGSYLII